jgi:hypothetical protein
MSNGSIKDFVLSTLAEQPGLGNEQMAELVREEFQGANTSAASISSIKSNARKSGELEGAELRNGNGDRPVAPQEDIPEDNGEDEEEIDARLRVRFDALDRMAAGVIRGVVPALIVSGPAGLGKSYGIEKALEKAETEDETGQFKFDVINGSISAVGLYIALYRMKDGGVVVLDDADDVFRDETTLNILKAALDSGDRRVISWRKQAHWLEAEGIEDRFEFNGRVIFLTNIDFEKQVNSGRPGSVHFKALMDRSLYLHLTLRTLRDYMVRIKQVVVGEDMLKKYGLEDEQIGEIIAYVEEYKTRFYHLSLRLIHQIALCRLADPENWKADVEMTKMKVA